MGYGYGPAFQGLRAAWRRGEELFAEVTLDTEQQEQAHRFGVHPALLDAALHTVFIVDQGSTEPQRLALPFSWSGVRIHRSGASSLRVRVTSNGEDAISLQRRPTSMAMRSLLVNVADDLRGRSCAQLEGNYGERPRLSSLRLGGLRSSAFQRTAEHALRICRDLRSILTGSLRTLGVARGARDWRCRCRRRARWQRGRLIHVGAARAGTQPVRSRALEAAEGLPCG